MPNPPLQPLTVLARPVLGAGAMGRGLTVVLRCRPIKSPRFWLANMLIVRPNTKVIVSRIQPLAIRCTNCYTLPCVYSHKAGCWGIQGSTGSQVEVTYFTSTSIGNDSVPIHGKTPPKIATNPHGIVADTGAVVNFLQPQLHLLHNS